MIGAQHVEGGIAVTPADDVGLLVLEQLVRLEEVLDLDQAVRPDLLQFRDVLLVCLNGWRGRYR